MAAEGSSSRHLAACNPSSRSGKARTSRQWPCLPARVVEVLCIEMHAAEVITHPGRDRFTAVSISGCAGSHDRCLAGHRSARLGRCCPRPRRRRAAWAGLVGPVGCPGPAPSVSRLGARNGDYQGDRSQNTPPWSRPKSRSRPRQCGCPRNGNRGSGRAAPEHATDARMGVGRAPNARSDAAFMQRHGDPRIRRLAASSAGTRARGGR